MNEAKIILPTDGLVTDMLNKLSLMSNAAYRLEDLIAQSIAALEYRTSSRIGEIAEQMYDRYAVFCGADSASILSKAWLAFTTELYEMYVTANLWNDKGRCDYFYRGMLGNDIVIERYPMDYKEPEHTRLV